MRAKIVEASDGILYLKAIVGVFDQEEWHRRRALPGWEHQPLLGKWTAQHFWILDLELGSGAVFKMGGLAHWDLDKAPAVF